MSLAIVASANPVKIEAARLGLARMFPQEAWTVSGRDLPSGVADQPMSDAETLQGALNRARQARAAVPQAQLWLGIEGGIEPVGAALRCFAWVQMLAPGCAGRSRTASHDLPAEVAPADPRGPRTGQRQRPGFRPPQQQAGQRLGRPAYRRRPDAQGILRPGRAAGAHPPAQRPAAFQRHVNHVAAALRAATQDLQGSSDTAALDAHLLLAQVTGRGRAWLLAHGEAKLTSAQTRRFSALVARRKAGEPLAYLRRRQAFYKLDFHVSPAVLIPRPESEQLLELALEHAPPDFSGVLVDVGTGSGALGISFAAMRPRARVILTDLSPAALAVARINAARHGVKPVFRQGDLLQPLPTRGRKVDIVMANLPYVRRGDLPQLAVSRYEPQIALDGGDDGMDLIRLLLQGPAAGLRAGRAGAAGDRHAAGRASAASGALAAPASGGGATGTWPGWTACCA